MFGSGDVLTYSLNDLDILTLLRQHKDQNRSVSPGLENGEITTLTMYKNWILNAAKEMGDIKSGLSLQNLKGPKANLDEAIKARDAKAHLDNNDSDLLAWMEINPTQKLN
jgi:hypothetical protein